jgi:outer membrane protein assembly factor BamB
VPEASGAAWLDIDGKTMLVVAGDSGNHGAYAIVDPDTGATTETGALPLTSEASDDIEGLAVRGGLMYGITSSGWIRMWRRVAKGFELVGTPYPIAPEGSDLVCAGRGINCRRNYEGLCLAPAPRGDCVGFAASKADGHLYCLTEDGGKLVVHGDRTIAVAGRGVVSDCAFGEDGTLWVGNNVFDLGNVYRVVHWDAPANATVERVGALTIGFPEVIAVRGDEVYRISDTGSGPSLMARFRCRR